MAPLWTLVAVFVAGTVKGIAGLGFPTLATPLLSLAVDVKTAVVLLILPNIVMDGIQFARRGAPTETIRRLLPLLAGGAIGTIVGTRLLVVLHTRTVLLLLGGFVVAFVALNATRVSPRLPAAWEPWVGPVAGFVAGVSCAATSPRSTSTPSSTPRTRACSAAAAWTAPSIAQPARACSRSAAGSAAVRPARCG